MALDVGGRRDDVDRSDQPPDPPPGHGVGLGHAVDHQAPVGQLGHQHRHASGARRRRRPGARRSRRSAPTGRARRPTGRSPRSRRAGTRPRSGSTGRRRAAPWSAGVHAASRSSTESGTRCSRRSGRRRAPRRPGRSPRDRSSRTGRGRGPRRPGRTARRRRWRRPACRRWSPAPAAAVTSKSESRSRLGGDRLTQGRDAGGRRVTVVGRIAAGRRPPPRRCGRASGSPARRRRTRSRARPAACSALALASTASVADGDTAATRREIRRSWRAARRGSVVTVQ